MLWSGAATSLLWVSDIGSKSSDRCNATAVGKSSMLCCSSTAVDSSPVICAWQLYFKVSEPTRAAGMEKKASMLPNLLHLRHLWRAMYCKSMVISN